MSTGSKKKLHCGSANKRNSKGRTVQGAIPPGRKSSYIVSKIARLSRKHIVVSDLSAWGQAEFTRFTVPVKDYPAYPYFPEDKGQGLQAPPNDEPNEPNEPRDANFPATDHLASPTFAVDRTYRRQPHKWLQQLFACIFRSHSIRQQQYLCTTIITSPQSIIVVVVGPLFILGSVTKQLDSPT